MGVTAHPQIAQAILNSTANSQSNTSYVQRKSTEDDKVYENLSQMFNITVKILNSVLTANNSCFHIAVIIWRMTVISVKPQSNELDFSNTTGNICRTFGCTLLHVVGSLCGQTH